MKKWGIIGALIIAAAVAVGYFFDFPAENIVTIAGATFGLCAVITGAMRKTGAILFSTTAAAAA